MVNLESAGDRRTAADRLAARTLVYLDHAATTPMLPEALAAMVAELAHTGNPSSLHNAGRRARRVVEESREQIAQAFGARPSEVVFTSGGTEADNLAVKGLFWARQAGPQPRRRVLATAIEHHAVLDSVQWLGEHQDAEVEWLSVDSAGLSEPGRTASRDRARSGQRRAGQRDVGEQRGRRGPADHAAGRGRGRVRRARSTATPSRRPGSCPLAWPPAGRPR